MAKSDSIKINSSFIQDVKEILCQARLRAYSAVNTAMVDAYWKIGQRIVEEEQNGGQRAAYGKKILLDLSKEMNTEYGKGFDERELRKMRQFYVMFPIRDSLRPELSWTHYRSLIRVSDKDARNYYINESAVNNWSVRTLDRNISTLYFERVLHSKSPAVVASEMNDKTAGFQQDNLEFIKNPYVLEFLDLPNTTNYKEAELEQAILDNLQKFLLELGKGFAFVARQKMVRTDTSDFFIDLVFYNFMLKCFVLIDLKTNKMTHQDIGQMDMYVRMFDDLQRTSDDNPTIGILLCTETDKTIAKYSVLKNNEQLFASKYKIFLPTEEQLKAEIEREKEFFKITHPSQNDDKY